MPNFTAQDYRNAAAHLHDEGGTPTVEMLIAGRAPWTAVQGATAINDAYKMLALVRKHDGPKVDAALLAIAEQMEARDE